MANTIADKIQELTDQVTATETVEASIVAYVNGVPALIQHAVDTAMTLPELQQKLTDLQVRLHASAELVSAAVAAAPKADETPVVDPALPAAVVKVDGEGTVTDPNAGGQA